MSSAPYDRQAGETAKAWDAFCAYRDAGPSRSIAKVAERLGKSATLIARWSSRHEWVDRVAAWQAHQDRIAQHEHEQQVREAVQAQARLGRSMREIVQRRVADIGNSDQMRPQDLAAWAKAAVHIERLALGIDAGTSPREISLNAPVETSEPCRGGLAMLPPGTLRTIAERMTPDEARAAAHAILRLRSADLSRNDGEAEPSSSAPVPLPPTD